MASRASAFGGNCASDRGRSDEAGIRRFRSCAWLFPVSRVSTITRRPMSRDRAPARCNSAAHDDVRFRRPDAARRGDRANSGTSSACRRSRRATSIAPRGVGRARSGSSTDISPARPRSGTRRSCGRFRKAFPCSAARAWAPCVRRSCTLLACAASAAFSRRSATERSKTTMKWPWSTVPPNSTTSPHPRRWSTFARRSRAPRSRAS